MKRIIPLTLVLIMLLSISVSAAAFTPKRGVKTPSLWFSDKTANCRVTITEPGKQISVTMELWQGRTLLKSWTDSGKSPFKMEREYTGVVTGQTYTLKVYGKSGGVAFSLPSTSRTA